MTLYEEYENGLDLVVYCEKAYQNLKKAVYITAETESIYDEIDIKVIWDSILTIGDIAFITEKNGARELLRNTFKMFDNYIDPRLVTLLRDYISMNINDFLSLYFGKNEFKRDKDRTILSNLSNDLEFLDCASTTGIRRKKNEDFACCIQSPINEKIKLLLVCDGMGGTNNGDKASEIVAKEIIKWFKTYGFNLGPVNLEKQINKVIATARNILKNSYFMTGTTLTIAIVGENETFIGNVGDSRTYIIKDGVLKQITKDDSKVWEEFYGTDYFEKDDFRFLRSNSIITEAIGGYLKLVNLQTYTILNSLYDGILLVSDGVTDILSDKTITRILSETADTDILDKLLYESCYGDPDFPSIDCDENLCPTLPGKDNASAVVYLKKLVKNK